MTRNRISNYYTVFVDYESVVVDGWVRPGGTEATVDPTLTRADIIDRLRSGEYAGKTSRVVQIDHTEGGITDDVTHELIEAAEQAARALEAV